MTCAWQSRIASHYITKATSPLTLQQENFEGALERRDDGMQWVHRVMHRKDLTQASARCVWCVVLKS